MEEFFKIERGKRGNGCPNRGERSTDGLVARPAGRRRLGFHLVSGGFSCRRPQSRQAQQVVCPRHEVAPCLRPFQSPIAAPPKSAHRLDPPKYLLHPFADFQTQLVARLACRAPVPPRHFYLLFGPESSIPSEAYFDASFAGYHGTAAQLTVLKDTDAEGNYAPGVDTFKWAAAYQTPPGFVPAQNIPDPDPNDGSVEDSDLLIQATSILSEVWSAAEVNTHLDTLSEPTLIHIQQCSFQRMWLRFRKLQLMMVAEELPQGVRLRARALVAEIHTQATIMRKTTLVVGVKYPSTQFLARMGRIVPVAGSICSVLSFADDANALVAAYAQYMLDVKRRCDNNNETALDLAVALSNVGDVAFPAPVLSAFLWPVWWNAFANFDGYSSSCF